ncbi:MAG: hypothetical protein ACYC6Y_08745 [Thermoguttaceae bacterium]
MSRFASNSERLSVFRCVLLACLLASPGLVECLGSDGPVGKNLALGKTCRFSPQPNYSYSTDGADASQPTDGKLTEGYFWTQQGTVGWSGASYATVTIDLKKVEPIGGASLRTAAGRADVTWPMALYVLVSEDGKTYREAGDLIGAYLEEQGSLPDDYAVVRFSSDRLQTRGRYVQLVMIPMPGGSYLFTDEIEVFRGDDRWLSGPAAGQVVENAGALFRQSRLRRSVERRINDDLRSVRALVDGSGLADGLRKALVSQLDGLAGPPRGAEAGGGAAFRAVLPLGERHARIFGVQAQVWKGQGHPGLTAWSTCPWDPVDPFAAPASQPGEIRVDAMEGETCAGAFNVANSGDRPVRVRIRMEGLPGGATPEWIGVHEVAWTDTSQLKPVAAALVPVEAADGAWTVEVASGLVRQVWLRVAPRETPAGQHSGAVLIEEAGRSPLRVPLSVRVWPMQFPERTTLWLGGWCYTDGQGPGLTDANRQEFVRHLQDRHVNAPWASGAVLRRFPFVEGRTDALRLDTERRDRWLAAWPGAKAYLVFLAVADYSGAIEGTLGGAKVGSPEFEKRVGTWISAWVGHLRSKGIEPSRLGILIHDEPHEGSEIGPLVSWARAIRKAEPEVLIWEDPTYREPDKAPAELFEACSILCPNRPMWLGGGESFAAFYGRQRQAGRTLQLYSCSGPARLLDPYSYYRLQAWHAWQIGATGSFFWAFGDNGGVSSWNEYYAARGPFTPLFLDETSVTAGKQMEAVRQSAEDYETLVMLRDAIAAARKAGRGDEPVQQAESLLDKAAERVLAGASAETLLWHAPKDRSVADTVRAELLGTLYRLQQGTDVKQP